MAKRFIDTGLFDDDWFMELSNEAKLLWIYFITKCNHAGMLKLNVKLCKVQTNIKELNTVIEQLGNRIITVKEQLYFIPKFLEYQYPGFPNSKAKAQLSAIEILSSFDLFSNGSLTIKELLPNSYSNNKGISISKGISKGRAKFLPPTVEDVKNYFKENGYSEESAIKAFEHYELGNWHDTNGKPVIAWKQKVHTVWFKPENKIKEVIIAKKRELDPRYDLIPNPDFVDPGHEIRKIR